MYVIIIILTYYYYYYFVLIFVISPQSSKLQLDFLVTKLSFLVRLTFFKFFHMCCILIISTGQDPTTGQSGELSFAVGLKNLILDTTNIPGGKRPTKI